MTVSDSRITAAPGPGRGRMKAGASTSGDSPCPVCAESLGVVVGLRDRRGRPLTTLSCVECGLMRTDPLPALEDLRRYHELHYRQSYKGVRRPKLKHVVRSGLLAANRFSRLARHLNGATRVLDVGCGSGEWLYVLGARGHSAVGLEPDPNYGEFGRQEYGVDIRTGSVLTAEMPEGQFDCATMFHVLEHIPDPLAALRRVHGWLKDGGVLVLEVPNAASLNQHPGKRFHYAHVIGFTPESLGLALRRGGWETVELSLDPDERNILAVVRKARAGEPRGTPDAAGRGHSFPEPLVTSVLATLRYYARAATYRRWFQRMKRSVSELRAISSCRGPLETLQWVTLAPETVERIPSGR